MQRGHWAEDCSFLELMLQNLFTSSMELKNRMSRLPLEHTKDEASFTSDTHPCVLGMV